MNMTLPYSLARQANSSSRKNTVLSMFSLQSRLGRWRIDLVPLPLEITNNPCLLDAIDLAAISLRL